MPSAVHVALLAAVCAAGTGCATVVHGRTQGISVASEPSGASVYDGANLVGMTPARVVLSRKRSDIVLRVQKEGYAPATIELKRKLSPWLAGDLAHFWWSGVLTDARPAYHGKRDASAAAAVFLGIDFLTGASHNLRPSKVHVPLTPLAQGAEASPGAQGEAAAPITEQERADAQKTAREWVQAAGRRKK